MNVILIKQILFVLFGTLGIITTIIGLFTSKEKRPNAFKIVAVFCTIVTVLYVSLSSYIEIINHNQFFADLIIYIGEPYVVNQNGTDIDKFVKNANYLVVSYNNGFSLDASIELTNLRTGEKFFYKTPLISDGYRIVNVGSGEYSIQITTNEYEVYSEHITLNSTNVDWDGTKNVWEFTAFMFEDFYTDASCFDVYIGDVKQSIKYPAFGIACDNISVYKIFRSEVDWDEGGLLAGKFWGYKDIYTVYNTINISEMDPVVIDLIDH